VLDRLQDRIAELEARAAATDHPDRPDQPDRPDRPDPSGSQPGRTQPAP
jgi:hypothetical protein